MLLAVGYLCTWSVYHRTVEFAIEHGIRFREDVMYYAGTMPLAAVFWIGGLAEFDLYEGRKSSKNRIKAGK